MDGLVHVSELSWKHVDHPGSVVAVGDEIEVQVLEVDLDRERISLSLKATQQDPWQEFAVQPPGRRARLRPGHQARALRRLRPGGRRHRGPGPHLGDVGPPRRPARAGRHAGRGAVGQDHRPRPPAPPHQPVDQAGRRGRRRGRRVPGALRRARLRRRGQLHRRRSRPRPSEAWAEYYEEHGLDPATGQPKVPTAEPATEEDAAAGDGNGAMAAALADAGLEAPAEPRTPRPAGPEAEVAEAPRSPTGPRPPPSPRRRSPRPPARTTPPPDPAA